MPKSEKEAMQDILSRYRQRVEKELGETKEQPSEKITTREYQQFRAEFLPAHFTAYEKACNLSEKILKIKPDKKKEPILQEAIDTAHLNITPTGVVSFAILAPLSVALFGSLVFFSLTQSTFFVFFFIIVAASLLGPLNRVPLFMAENWRLKASNQMVLCIFYVVTYMRHTSNMEKAVEFASDHLSPPLSLDLRKVLWDVETGKYESLKESLDAYLTTWKKYNLEFVESFHLIQSSLYEGEETRRLAALDKSLDVILEETYEKMLHYAHNLKSPITMLHMLGVILPILGLVILPLVVSFMENVKWYHIATIYNIAIPIAVYVMGKNILSKRPTGYGDTDISEDNPQLKKYRNILIKIGKSEMQVDPLWVSIILGAVLFIIGISPLLMHLGGVPDIGFGRDDPISVCGKAQCLLGYQADDEGIERGPFGLGSAILGFFVTLAVGLAVGLYFKLRSQNVIKIRDRAKELEQEFASALFQLGNRIGDNIPAEMAVGRVADLMEGTTSGNFFQLVSQNIRKLGMSVQKAIFDPKQGALAFYPSSLIESSMKVLIESVKKGPQIAAQALMNVSRYIKEIHKVNERLKDLMADIISSMGSQIKFLTPVISGIVIGITSMISSIIGKLGRQVDNLQSGSGMAGASVPNVFDFKVGIPTFYFQIIVGIYVVQIVYILTVLSNGIQNGSDKLSERFNLGVNLIRSTILYTFIALVITVMFNMIAASILGSSI